MKKPIQQWSTWFPLLGVLFVLALSFALAGCGSRPPAEQLAEAVVAEPVAAMAEEALAVEAAVETAVTQKEPIDECLACHLDKEMLIATADPVEEVISESEGEG